MKKRLLAGLLAGMLVLSITGCGKKQSSSPDTGSISAVEPTAKTEAPAKTKAPSKTEKPAKAENNTAGRDVLHVAILTDPEGLDPQKTAATSTYFVTMNIFETLIRVDENWEPQPCLAESWEVAEDHRSITFHLKKGVKFHNGREMKAEDVKFSIERLHEDDSPKKKYYANITEAEIADDYTITFRTKEADAVLLTNFAYPWSVIVPSECVSTLKTKPVGTGAYTFVKWTAQEEVKLTRNDAYHGEAPAIKDIDYIVKADATSAMVGLLSGDVDLFDATGENVDILTSNPEISLYKKGINSVTILGINLDHPILANEKVRQAMACAIDKDEIINSINQGFGDKVGSYLPSSAAEYIDTNSVHPYDEKRAKELLAEAGYPDGFSIGLTLPKSYPIYANTGQIIADQLGRIGIQCKIEIVEWADWMQNVYTDKKYDMTVMANSGRLSAYDFISRFHSGSGDYISYKTGEADGILEELAVELNEERRMQLVKDFEELVADKVPVVAIETPHRIYAMNSSLKGYTMYPTETTEFRLLRFE